VKVAAWSEEGDNGTLVVRKEFYKDWIPEVPLLRYVSHAHPELAAGLTAGNPIKLIYMGGLPTETLANHELSQTTIEHRTVTEEM